MFTGIVKGVFLVNKVEKHNELNRISIHLTSYANGRITERCEYRC